MRDGVRLGIDVGRARVGIASSDRGGLLATPLVTIARERLDEAAVRVLVEEHRPIELVVGLPLSLSGADTASTRDAREVARWLARTSGVPVRLVDERLSTVTAEQSLRASGRKASRSRDVIDQVAAMIILQHALDRERSGGTPPGTIVDPDEGAADRVE